MLSTAVIQKQLTLTVPDEVKTSSIFLSAIVIKEKKSEEKAVLCSEENDLVKEGIKVGFKIPYTELTLEKEIAKGSFGKVVIGEWKGIKVAIKLQLLDRNRLDSEDFKEECEMLEKLQYLKIPHLLAYGGCGNLPKSEKQFMVTEYVADGTLLQWLQEFTPPKGSYRSHVAPEQACNEILLNILAFIVALHKNRIVHGDLKSENILLYRENYKVKLCDYGAALQLKEGEDFQNLVDERGTPGYIAPEAIYIYKMPTPKLGFASDMFSFGSIMFEVSAGRQMFSFYSSPYMANLEIKSNHLPKVHPEFKCNEKIAGFIKRCWEYDPSKRPTADGLYAEFKSFVEESRRLSPK